MVKPMKHFAKLITVSVILVMSLFARFAKANEWEWIIKCHTRCGGAVIDKNLYNASVYQLVVKDATAIRHLLESDAIFEDQINDKNEFITNLNAGRQDNFDYTVDIKGIKRKYQAVYFNGALLVEAFAIAGDGRTVLYKIADYSFHYCN
jgi:hypothetical protein